MGPNGRHLKTTWHAQCVARDEFYALSYWNRNWQAQTSYCCESFQVGLARRVASLRCPKFVPPRWGRPRFDPTQTGLCKFGWVWSALISFFLITTRADILAYITYLEEPEHPEYSPTIYIYGWFPGICLPFLGLNPFITCVWPKKGPFFLHKFVRTKKKNRALTLHIKKRALAPHFAAISQKQDPKALIL